MVRQVGSVTENVTIEEESKATKGAQRVSSQHLRQKAGLEKELQALKLESGHLMRQCRIAGGIRLREAIWRKWHGVTTVERLLSLFPIPKAGSQQLYPAGGMKITLNPPENDPIKRLKREIIVCKEQRAHFREILAVHLNRPLTRGLQNEWEDVKQSISQFPQNHPVVCCLGAFVAFALFSVSCHGH